MTPPDDTLLLKSSLKALTEDPKEAHARFKAAAQANGEPCPSCGKVIVHRKGLGWCQDQEMNEEGKGGLRERVTRRALSRHWKVQHLGRGIATFDSKGDPMFLTTGDPGWPDLTLVKAGHRVIWMELKRQDGEVSPEQLEWLQLLNRTGNYAIVIRPKDLREGRVNAILDAGAPL